MNMAIEKVFGVQATSLTMDERFTILAKMPPDRAARPRRHPMGAPYRNQRLNYMSQNMIDQIIRRLQYEAKKQALRQRLGRGQGRLRRAGSEGNLSALRRSNSYGNLSQNNSAKSQFSGRQSNISLSNWSGRSVTMNYGWGARGGRRRGGPRQRGRFRDGRPAVGRLSAQNGVQTRGAARARGAARGRGAVRGQKGILKRPQTPKPIPTKEELDAQLDQYMAGTKAALDMELEAYMKTAMDLDFS